MEKVGEILRWELNILFIIIVDYEIWFIKS